MLRPVLGENISLVMQLSSEVGPIHADPGRVEQIPFSRSSVSLAEAVATAGGVNPGVGNPAAIFVFRYVQDEQGNEMPMVYHLNMMKTGSYFLAQRFAMRDKDVLYFGNAAANTLHGGGGADSLWGYGGNDMLFGDEGADTFVITAGFGKDTIADFGTSGTGDSVRFLNGTFSSFADLMSHAAQQGDDVVFTLDANNSVTLQNTQLAMLSAQSFTFG